jgi:tetratricopeptide (TPR) repeat protein
MTVDGGRAALGLSLAISLFGLSSRAEGAPQRRDQGPLFTQIDTGQAAAANARALAARGQCDQALPIFDQALRSTIDMSIRRDRGLCHEALGNPYPAMEDYRAYLQWRPDGPDAADIRARLERLEIQTGVGGPSTVRQKSAEDVPDEPALADESAPGTTDDGKRKVLVQKTYDEEEAVYKDYDQAMASPLRRGHGAIFGVYSDVREWYVSAAASVNGASNPSVEVGGAVRWAFDGWNALYGQIGYVDYTNGGGAGGVGLGLGYELRLRLDEYATHNLLLGAVVEYQRIGIGDSSGGPVSGGLAGGTFNLLIPEGKVGYRLVLGHGFGIELTGDVGTVVSFNSLGPVGVGAQGFVAGGALAFQLAF